MVKRRFPYVLPQTNNLMLTAFVLAAVVVGLIVDFIMFKDEAPEHDEVIFPPPARLTRGVTIFDGHTRKPCTRCGYHPTFLEIEGCVRRRGSILYCRTCSRIVLVFRWFKRVGDTIIHFPQWIQQQAERLM